MKKYYLLLLLIPVLLLIMTNVYADANYVTDSLNGEYSLTSLTKKYQMITFGLHNPIESNIDKGDLYNFSYIEGPVIVNGNLYTDSELEFSTRRNNKSSYIAGDMGGNVYTDGMVATNDDFVNFEEMYVRVANEQKMLLERSTNLVTDDIVITSPGSYTIQNTSRTTDLVESYHFADNTIDSVYLKKIYIDNYNSDDYYVFNILNEYVLFSFSVFIREAGDATYHNFNLFADGGNYSGNIIFSYPNARVMDLVSAPGTIVAPKADIYLSGTFEEFDGVDFIGFFGNIYANSIQSGTNSYGDNYGSDGFFHFIPNSVSKELISDYVKGYFVEYEDYSDDIYDGSYSLVDLLENYSIVSLGQKNYESNSKFLNHDNYKNGSVALFHIAGPFLISGDLGIRSHYPNYTGWDLYVEDAMRLDFESNRVSESNVAGSIRSPYITKFWQLHGEKIALGSTNLMFTSTDQEVLSNLSLVNGWSEDPVTANTLLVDAYSTYYFSASYKNPQYREIDGNFINYKRLYDSIVAQQDFIKKGQGVSPSNGVVHVGAGSNYVIDNISDVSEIIIDDFDKNKDEVTIITINDSGAIQFPKVSRNSDGYRGVVTNDYYGKGEASYSYEYSNFVTDTYHGNVIWNVPNATFIELSEGAPFFGHLVAPNADVETPELQFAGCFIVNSLYCEGNTEAHFYPLTASKTNIFYTGDDGVQKSVLMRIGKALGEDYIKADKVVLGDYDEYLEDLKREESEGIPTINPYTIMTFGNLMIVLLIISIVLIYKKSKKKTIER